MAHMNRAATRRMDGNRMRTVNSTLLLCAAAAVGAMEEMDIKDASGAAVLHYAVEAPKDAPGPDVTDPAKQLGLILSYHEHDSKVDAEMPPVIKTLARLQLSDKYVVIGIHHVEHRYSQADRVHTAEVIAWARKTYAINPRRVYDYGKGEGATMSAEFALAHPELIASAITYSWGFFAMPDAKNPVTELPGIYMVIGMADTPTHIPMVRSTYAKAKPHGYQLIYREFDKLAGSTDHPPSNDEALTWALATRNKVLPLAPQELALLKPIASAGAARALIATPAVIDGIVLVGGLQAGSLVGPLFDARDEATRIAAIASAERTYYGEDALAALAKKLKDPSAAVRKAALSALGVNARWHSAVAHEALIQFAAAANRKAAAEERALAVAGMGLALTLQLGSPHVQDIDLAKALVALLDDDSVEVRTQAFAVLKPALPDSPYKPEDDKAARGAGMMAWNAWLAATVAKEETAPAAGAKK
jgi:enterochelin esterase-like enzyme